MCSSQCLFAVVALFISTVNSWDIALTTGDQIEFYSKGKITQDKGVRSTGLTALAYDAVQNMLLFVDKQSDNASIFRYNVATKKSYPLVGRKSYEDIQGIAFDPVSSKIFWTDENEKGIYWKPLESKNDVYGHRLNINLTDEVPRAIAVDSCRGYIYWTNININKPSIERARIDGSDRQVIVNTDVFMPMSITLDQQSNKIYWADDREGIHYSIESSDLDGENRKTIVKGVHHRPNAIAASKDNLYWIDWGYAAVWKVPKTARSYHDGNEIEPEQVFSFLGTPFGIVANYSIEDQTDGVKECDHLRSLAMNKSVINDVEGIAVDSGVLCLHGQKVEGRSVCKCKAGYKGERCEIPVCENYCLEGECSLTLDGKPKCSCKDGYSGSRCEIDLCYSRCFAGKCVFKDQKAVCECNEGYSGERCEVKRTLTNVPLKAGEFDKEENCNCTAVNSLTNMDLVANDGDFVETCNNGWDPLRDPIILVLGTICGLLCLACAAFITKIMKLKKRPRIKKRIIVQKNSTPLTARPDQCEITIENCCNMNICETPCFEPRSTIRPNLLDAKPGKEEKSNLISNMELPDDY